MDWRVVFDVSQQSMDWQFPAFGLPFVGVGLLIVLGRNRAARNRSLFAWLWLGFAVFWVTTSFISIAMAHHRAVSSLTSGDCSTAEGYIENFEPETPRHKRESFTVGGVPFAYSQYVISPGFRQTSAEGGPLGNGIPVRLWYHGSDILRVEVAGDTLASSPSSRTPSAMLVIPFILFPVMWIIIVPLIAVLGGWRSLAGAHPGPATLEGVAYSWQSLQLGILGNYNNCIEVTVGQEGIHLLPILLFRLGHPPILLPWTEVRACAETRWFLRKAARVELQDGTSLRVLGAGGAEVVSQWRVRQLS